MALTAVVDIVGDVGAGTTAAELAEGALVAAGPAVVPVPHHVPAMLLAALKKARAVVN